MNKEILINGVDTGLGNRFKAQVVENGVVVRETDWASNLILETGMNAIAGTLICNLFTHCAIGDGSTPTEDSSGAITATASGTTVTAGSSIFTVNDVNKLLRFATGEKAMISAFVSGTQVTLATPLTVGSPTLFTMYRVNQTGLDNELQRSNTYLTGAGNCESTYSGGTLTHRRTFEFPIETVDQGYNEVGFSGTGTVGSNLNMRGIFSGAPVAVLVGQQLRVVYDVLVTLSPVSSRIKEAPIAGWPSLEYPVAVDDGTDLITLVGHGFPAQTKVKFNGAVAPGGITFGTDYYVVSNNADTFKISETPGGAAIDITSAGTSVVLFTNTNGAEQLTAMSFSGIDSASGITTGLNNEGVEGNSSISEPAAATRMALTTDATAIPTFNSMTNGYPFYTAALATLSADSYISGSFVKTLRATYPTTSGNSSENRKVYLCRPNNPTGQSGKYRQVGLCFLFDWPQEKTNLFTLTFVWKFAWDRDFV